MWHSLASSSKYLEALERELIESDNYTLLCRVISETKAAVSSETDRDCACISLRGYSKKAAEHESLREELAGSAVFDGPTQGL